MTHEDTFRKLALSFPGASEKPHFERTSFRVKGKIFATLAENTNIATLNLSTPDQADFCSIEKQAVCPAPNNWGQKGWTLVELNHITEELALEMLTAAFKKITA
jgi:predicted DNA-binding protein (MmcQ/YjbR family)